MSQCRTPCGRNPHIFLDTRRSNRGVVQQEPASSKCLRRPCYGRVAPKPSPPAVQHVVDMAIVEAAAFAKCVSPSRSRGSAEVAQASCRIGGRSSTRVSNRFRAGSVAYPCPERRRPRAGSRRRVKRCGDPRLVTEHLLVSCSTPARRFIPCGSAADVEVQVCRIEKWNVSGIDSFNARGHPHWGAC